MASRTTAFLKSKYVLSLFFILVLCLIDGVLTIFLVEKGAWEANPLMRYAISISYEFFFIVKYFLTATGFMFLLIHGDKRFLNRIFSLNEIAGGLILFYEGLVVYELSIYHIIK